MIRRKTFIISYILIIIVTAVSFFLLVHYHIFKKTQGDHKSSIESGYGYYGDPIEGPCVTSDGNCNTTGVKKITKKCIVHPVTKKGCLTQDGTMTYDNLVESVSCKKQCRSAGFTYNNGVQITEAVDESGNDFFIPVGTKGGYLVNELGIDYTNTFVQGFDSVNNKYLLKRCLNTNEYLGYSIASYECNAGDDILAANKCVFSCDRDNQNTLRSILVNDNDLGITTYNYPKVDGRYRCLDFYGNNQIEVLNQGSVPADFNYPSQCFEHFLNDGLSTTVKLDNSVLPNQKFYTLDGLKLQSYNLIYDYNFYYPLEIGLEKTIAEKIIDFPKKIQKDSSQGFIYLDMDRDFSSTADKINIGTEIVTDFHVLKENNILAIPLSLFFNELEKSQYYYSNNTMYLNIDSSDFTNVGDYIYYYIDSLEVDSKASIAKVDSLDLGEDYYIGLKVADLGEDAYKYGIAFYNFKNLFKEPINPYNQTGGVSANNRVENNKFFLSELLLPLNNFNSLDLTNKLVNIYPNDYFTNPPERWFYLYSESTRSFYYPVTRSTKILSDYNFTIPEYGETVFYLTKGGVSNTVYPPSKKLGLESFEELNGFIQAEAILSSYGSYINYIKSYRYLSNSTNLDSTYYIFNDNFSDFYTIENSVVVDSINTAVEKISNLAINTDLQTSSIDNPFFEKMKIYNSLTVQNFNDKFFNKYSQDFNLTLGVSRAIVKVADFDVFKTPDLVDSETGNIIQKSICFDNFGKPLQPGTNIQIQPGQKVVYYQKADFNADDFICGYYGVSGGSRATDERVSDIPSLGTSTLVSREPNKYYNYLDFLEDGYNIENLFCYSQADKSLLESNIKNCREPYTTRLFNHEYYNTNENLLDFFNNENLYYSNTINNIDSPAKAKNWTEVLEYKNRPYTTSDTSLYDFYNNYYFIYDTQDRGVVGESLAKLGVYYLYKKANSIYDTRFMERIMTQLPLEDTYYLNQDYHQNNWYSESVSTSSLIRSQNDTIDNLSNQEASDNYLYDIDLSFVENTKGTSLYTYSITVETGENFSQGDIFNPDFNFFNSILLADGISTFSFPSSSGYTELIYGSSIINNATINSNLTVDSLVFIAYDKDFDFNQNFQGGINIYNYAFEVCKVLDFDKNLSRVTLERNLLNYPKSSNFVGTNVDYTAYLLDSSIDKNLIFNIESVNGTKITFNFDSYSLNPPEIEKIKSNNQSRTALSARIIKKNIDIPTAHFPGSTTNLYLSSSPEKNRVSAFLDLMIGVVQSSGKYDYYFNQYREDNYTSNGQETIFYPGDVINLNINGQNYSLTINATKVTYQNSLYDYYSSQVEESIGGVEQERAGFARINGVDYYIDNSIPTMSEPTILGETINYLHPDKIKYGEALLDPQDYSSDYYNKLADLINPLNYSSLNYSVWNNFNSIQNVDKGLNIPIMTLSSTRLYPNLDNLSVFLTIGNINLNSKPYGPSYLKDLATSNTLNLEGYGTMISFDITGNNLINRPSSDLVLTSRSGFKFSFSEEVASFSFKTLARKTEKSLTVTNKVYTTAEPTNYNSNLTYGLEEIVFYNYEKPLIYQNVNSRLSLFDSQDTSYDQPYYIFEDNFYKYPLYLENKNLRVAKPIEGSPVLFLYYDSNDYVDNGTSRPSLNIYKEFSLKNDLRLNANWKQVSNSIYPLSSLAPYNSRVYYNNGDLVLYENNVYSSVGNNYNKAPVFGLTTNWILDNTYGTLTNNNNYFFNKNIGSSLSVADLSLSSKLDIDNYPLSLIDYGSSVNYTLREETKGVLDYTTKLNEGFLSLDIFSKQLEILGKAMVFTKDNNVITLASSPITEDNLDNYDFLKEYSSFGTNTLLSQYIYNIKLPDVSFSGRPFCTGNTPYNNNLSNYTFANSITFLTVPVDIEYQDYPRIEISSGTSIYKNPPLSIVNGSRKVIKNTNNNYSLIDVGVSNSYYVNINNFNPILEKITNGKGYLYESGSYNFKFDFIFDDSREYYVFHSENILDFKEDIKIYNNAPWYINNNKGQNVASGFLRFTLLEEDFLVASSINPLKNLFICSINLDILEESESLIFYLNENVKVENVEITTLPVTITLSNKTATLGEGEYLLVGSNLSDVTNLPNTEAFLSFDDENNPISFNKYYLSNNSLQPDDKLYFLPKYGMSNLKVKMYGFFDNQYLSEINYASENTIASPLGKIPNLIFSPFKNKLLNPYYNNLSLVDSDGTKPVINSLDENKYSNVFNLASDGTSLTLLTNFYKNPIFNSQGEITTNNSPLLGAIGTSGNSRLGAINTNSVINFTAEPFDFNDHIIIGNAEEVIPFDDEVNDNNQYYREIKAGLNTNVDSLLNCSIYNTSQGNFYRIGENLNLVIKDATEGKILTNLVEGVPGSLIFKNTANSLLYNSTNILEQNDPSNKNYPIYIGLSAGTSFSDSLVYGTQKIDDDTNIIITYVFNNIGVTKDTYYKITGNQNYNDFQYRAINVVLTKNDFYNPLASKNIYLGYKDSAGTIRQFSGGINTLKFIDYG